MIDIVVIYHSGYGHTEVIAKSIHEGVAKVEGTSPQLIKIGADGKISEAEWAALDNAHAIIFGAPTYMGSLSGSFKLFADSSSKPWFSQKWKDKIAGGFTNSGGLSGDKLSSITQLAILAAQHGMIWVGNAFMSSGHQPTDINRIGSYLGMMAQSDNVSPQIAPPQGDKDTAHKYGERIAQATLRWNKK